jgi:hypothetical protein
VSVLSYFKSCQKHLVTSLTGRHWCSGENSGLIQHY